MTSGSPAVPVFVYGTLRTGQPGYGELGLAARTDSLGPALVAGTLYDLGEYPGAVLLNNAGMIMGELLLPRDDGLLSLLDAFELYDPADPDGSEYLRVMTTVDGRSTVWIYVYNFALEGAVVIASGDWNDRILHAADGSSLG